MKALTLPTKLYNQLLIINSEVIFTIDNESITCNIEEFNTKEFKDIIKYYVKNKILSDYGLLNGSVIIHRTNEDTIKVKTKGLNTSNGFKKEYLLKDNSRPFLFEHIMDDSLTYVVTADKETISIFSVDKDKKEHISTQTELYKFLKSYVNQVFPNYLFYKNQNHIFGSVLSLEDSVRKYINNETTVTEVSFLTILEFSFSKKEWINQDIYLIHDTENVVISIPDRDFSDIDYLEEDEEEDYKLFKVQIQNVLVALDSIEFKFGSFKSCELEYRQLIKTMENLITKIKNNL